MPLVASTHRSLGALNRFPSKRSASGVIVFASGYGETGLQENIDKQARLAEIGRAANMRIIGPNCLGVLAPRIGLDASFAAHRPPAGDLAVISQSGAVTVSLLAFAAERRVGFSGLVSVGDMADVDFDDLLDWFAIDAGTRAILLYVEAIQDASAFMSAARAAARVKPVIVIKAGRSRRAAQAAATHTGALAGADDV